MTVSKGISKKIKDSFISDILRKCLIENCISKSVEDTLLVFFYIC